MLHRQPMYTFNWCSTHFRRLELFGYSSYEEMSILYICSMSVRLVCKSYVSLNGATTSSGISRTTKLYAICSQNISILLLNNSEKTAFVDQNMLFKTPMRSRRTWCISLLLSISDKYWRHCIWFVVPSPPARERPTTWVLFDFHEIEFMQYVLKKWTLDWEIRVNLIRQTAALSRFY